MSTRQEKGLARSIFRLQKKGNSVPDKIRASARRIIQNSNTDQDLRDVRSYLGISRSGAGFIGRASRSLQRVQNVGLSITRDIELLGQSAAEGKGTAAGTARILNTLNLEMQRLVKSKKTRDFLEGTLQKIGQDPVMAGRFLKSIGRGLRLGGVVATVALKGFEVAENIQKARKEAADARSKALTQARDLYIDPERSREIYKDAIENVKQNRGWLSGLLNDWEWSPWRGEDEKKAAKEKIAIQTNIEAARKRAPDLGIDVGSLYANLAASKNKPISELTSREKSRALDAAIEGHTRQVSYAVNLGDEKSFQRARNQESGRISSIQALMDSERVRQQIDREYRSHFYGAAAVAGKDILALMSVGAVQSGNQFLRERARELAIQYQAEELKTLQEERRDALDAADRKLEQRTAEEQYKLNVEKAISKGDWTSKRSRHKAWSTS